MPDEPRERPFILQWRSAVLNASLTATQKLCLLVLAEWAEKDGTDCFPAITSMALKASVNEKTMRRSLEQAVDAGFITRFHRGSSQGWRRFEYVPVIPQGADTRSARQSSGADTESAPLPERAGTVSTPEGVTCGHSVHDVRTLSPERAGTVSDEVSNELSNEVGLRDISLGDRFQDFWKIYPRKDAKQAAEKSWRRQKLDPQADRIVEDVTARIADPGQWTELKFIPYGSTYLNQARWRDEWQPAGKKTAGAIERDARTDEEIERANAEQLAKFGLKDAA